MTIKLSDTKVKDLMASNPTLIDPESTLQEAAKRMKSIDCGALPVGTDKEVTGMITDRDIVIRAIAAGKDPSEEHVADYMTTETYSCNEQDALDAAVDKMHEHKVNRLIVKNEEGKVTGILSYGRFLRADASPEDIAGCIKGAA